MVRISCGKVDPVTGHPVTPETPPVPGNGAGVRRSATHQPSRSGDRGRSTAHSKSATMPTTTPSWARNQQGQRHQGQQQQQQSGRNSWGGGRKQPHESIGRASQPHPSRKHGGGGGLLKDMFERARSRAEDKKENFPPNDPDAAADAAALQDVSEIVLACGSGKTPARADRASGSGASAATAAAVSNPFAKKPRSTAGSNPSPSDFRTPSASITEGGVRSAEGAAPLAGYAGGDSDAWSRLSKGCLAAGVRGGEEDAVIIEEGGAAPRDDLPKGVTPPKNGNGKAEAKSGACSTVSAAAESVGVKPVAPKRSLSAPSRGGRNTGSGRGKKELKLGGGGRKSQSHPPPAGKGATMLSFFGRAASSKP